MQGSQERIQFRFGQSARHYYDTLVERAETLNRKPNDYARDLVIAALEYDVGAELRAIRSELEENRAELENLRSDLAYVLESILVNILDKSEDAVREHVSKRLRRTSP